MSRAWLLLALLVLPPAHAEQFVERDSYVIHYAALKTTDLTPEVARQFGVQRSRSEAFLVINAQRRQPDGRTVPVPATATGEARSLIGHVQKLDLRPVREGDVHYVVATFEVVNQEYLTLMLQVTPQGAAGATPIKFQQQFYLD